MTIKRMLIGGQQLAVDSETGELIVRDQSQTGTGLPIPLPLSDPAGDGWSDALATNIINRTCTRLRVIVADSGCVLSFDGGATEHFRLPADMAEDMAIAIPAGSDVRVKRYTAGTPITGLIVEVR